MEEGEGEGELVKSEELYERLHCMKCNFVTDCWGGYVGLEEMGVYLKLSILYLKKLL